MKPAFDSHSVRKFAFAVACAGTSFWLYTFLCDRPCPDGRRHRVPMARGHSTGIHIYWLLSSCMVFCRDRAVATIGQHAWPRRADRFWHCVVADTRRVSQTIDREYVTAWAHQSVSVILVRFGG